MTMSKPRDVAATVHDAIDEVATAVEGVHKTIADFPLFVLGEITPFKETLDEVKATQDRTIEAIYGLVRSINARVRELTTSAGA
jgi:hypothetical protein